MCVCVEGVVCQRQAVITMIMIVAGSASCTQEYVIIITKDSYKKIMQCLTKAAWSKTDFSYCIPQLNFHLRIYSTLASKGQFFRLGQYRKR